MSSDFDALVASLDYPMTIVTCAAGGVRAGCLVGFTTQCSMEPPRWWVCLSKANHTLAVAAEAGALAVHFPGVADMALARLFGSECGAEVDKFSRCAWRPWAGDGVTPLLDGVGRWLVGPVLAREDGGDHVGFLVEVAEAGFVEAPALTFQSARDLPPAHPV